MCSKALIIVFLVSLCYIKESYAACADKLGLSSVDAYVHKQRNAKAIRFEAYNFNLLDEYIAIDLTRANVGQLCEGMIKNFPRLETLSLINVNLTLIEPGTFQTVPKLKHVSLSVNLLTNIPRGVFNAVPSLKVLYLSRNLIETIEDGAFSQMPQLKAVYLNQNKITQLTGNVFFGSPKISVVDFSFNQIETIQNNAFDDLRPINSTKILNIYLQKNKIAKVEKDAIIPLVPVNLHLDYNFLTLMSDIVFAVKDGSAISLNSNQIGCISDDVIDEIRRKQVAVYVNNNPVTCDCLKRIDELLGDAPGRGELQLTTTFPCAKFASFFDNNY